MAVKGGVRLIYSGCVYICSVYVHVMDMQVESRHTTRLLTKQIIE